MKKLIFAVSALFLILGLAVSCSKAFSTVTIEKEQSFALAEGRQDSLVVRMEIEYPRTGMSEEAAASMAENITSVLLDIQYMELTPEAAAAAYIEAKAAEFRENNLPLLEIAMEEDSPTATLSWEDYSTGHLLEVYDGIVSYKATKYTYTGGAHGITMETNMNFNLKTGALLSEGDLFTENYEKTVSELLTKHLNEALQNPQDADMLFQKELSPNGNFSVSAKGVTYTFNQYEIGPYALGIIDVTIPWEEIKHIIKKQV